MDKNTLAGFGLLMLLLVGYIMYNQKSEANFLAQKKADSIENAKLHPPITKQADTTNLVNATSQAIDSTASLQTLPEKEVILENDEVAITLSNHGGYAKKVNLKNYKTSKGEPLILFEGPANQMDFGFKSKAGSMLHSREMYFEGEPSADKKSITFSNGDMQISYLLPAKGYMVEMKTQFTNADAMSPMNLNWKSQSLLTENDIQTQQQYTQVAYNVEKEGVDLITIKDKETKDLNEEIKWLTFKQHYFNTTIIPDAKTVKSGKLNYVGNLDTVKKLLSNFEATLALNPQSNMNFKWYLGPNDYKALKAYGQDLQEMLPLSYGIFGFVKYINLWLIMPIWNLLSKFFSSYGIVILLLTFILRLLMSPFTYKSYVSSAKMKALKPELDELRAKHGDDQQAFGVEQMKLYRQAGVNPLGGCLPALLQLPVFFALLAFFPQAIELRQSKFLWAKDLSTFDSILDLGFEIPFYGNHVSLFTILFVITSLALALYSMNMTTQDQNNPMMKYLPFIMPVMFLGIFNKLPASLTFYYFVSNVITLGLQFVIQNYIINPDKIHAQIQAKKNEPVKENKLMAKMAEMQRQQQERSAKQVKK